ncbi:MAG TPA: hypothetical protein DCZ01_05190 [Elusimicrobia bacterium]|nr:MAG: hypothetical protein A2X37_08335 [Elusimicrobia bacterium GWA2_66_18]OGR73616.1 MAG: hypothetical protein A2X40_04640 [Elusimicrobia bacterium GWC2_65_9]HAZ07918.1 hypothetical protein [Elusimicrobiota bacterium]
MLTVTRRILVSAPRDSVQLYLSDLQEIAKYEPKVDAIEVSGAEQGSSASVTGRFLGLPWRGTFRFEMTKDGGYRGVMVSGPLRRMECRMILRPVIGGTLVEHEEAYELPLLMRPLKSLMRRWLDATLDNELGFIKEGAEALNRRLHLQGLEA